MNIKQVKGFEKYKISDCGKVFSARNGKEMKAQINDGYYVVRLFDGTKYHFKRVHRLVAENFLDNPECFPIVNHIDHVRTNNHVSNLEWCDHSHNSSESAKKYPERWKNNSSIDAEMAHKICTRIQEGGRNKEISEELGVSRDIVTKIRNKRSWRDVSKNYAMTRDKFSVSEETVRWVCRMISKNLSNREILSRCSSKGVSRELIRDIKSKNAWEHISKEYF